MLLRFDFAIGIARIASAIFGSVAVVGRLEAAGCEDRGRSSAWLRLVRSLSGSGLLAVEYVCKDEFSSSIRRSRFSMAAATPEQSSCWVAS